MAASQAITDQLKNLTLEDVIPLEKAELGHGAYGKVFTVKYLGLPCAAKEIHSILLYGVSPEERKTIKDGFIRECYHSSLIRHPNIVQFMGIYYAESSDPRSDLPIMVMELMDTSLTSFIKDNQLKIAMEIKVSMLHDVSLGLSYLHGRRPAVIHRDLSSNNVLLSKGHLVAKISDLGTAKMVRADSKQTKSKLTTAPGTVHFMPPEALEEDDPVYGTPVDVFSFAGVALHIFSEEWPKPTSQVKKDKKTKKLVALTEAERRQHYLDKMRGRADVLKEMVERCLENDPDDRPSIKEVSGIIESFKKLKADLQANIFEKKVKWEEVASLPVGRSTHSAVTIGEVVYVGGGFEVKSVFEKQSCYRLDVYNLATNQWSCSPIIAPFKWFAMTVLDNKLIIAGGVARNGEVVKKVLALSTGQWKDYSEMPTARHSATAVGYHSVLIVLGGASKVNGNLTRLSTVELLNSSNECWYACNDLPSPHQQLKSVIMKDKLYLLNGQNEDFEPSLDVFVASLDTLSDNHFNWHCAPNAPWCYSTPVVVCNTSLLIVGGFEQSDASIKTNSVHLLNASNDNWEYLMSIPAARSGAAVVTMNDKILVIGGVTSETREFSTTVWVCSIE